MRERDEADERVLRWVERTVGRGARVVGRRRLAGGIVSIVHLLRIEVGGARRDVILKTWPESHHPSLARAVRAEASALASIAATALPAPELLGLSEDGAGTGGGPALLMTRLPGRIDLTPRDPAAWIGRIAAALAAVHAAPVEAPPFVRWIRRRDLTLPADTTRPALWREAFATLGRETRVRAPVFLHRDFQHFNLLWRRGAVSGIVDWASACRGPAAIDVGHCRLNLAVLMSPDWAERLREAYEAETGAPLDPSWDVHALLAYEDGWRRFIPIQVAGRRRVDGHGMTARVEEVLARALRRRG